MTNKPKKSKATKKNPTTGVSPPKLKDAPVIANQQDKAGSPLVINAQYIKDLSFEAPNAPQIFSEMQKQSPSVSINIDVKAQLLKENIFEVFLHINTECKAGEKTAFIQELVYGGVFTINLPKEHIQPALLIECPRLLFPFARNIIADSSRDGGFPPLMLGTIDFADMYRKKLQAAAKPDSKPMAKTAVN